MPYTWVTNTETLCLGLASWFSGSSENDNMSFGIKKMRIPRIRYQNIQTKWFSSEPSVLCGHMGSCPCSWYLPVPMVCNSSCYNSTCLLSVEDGLLHRSRFAHGDVARCLHVLRLQEPLGNNLSLSKFCRLQGQPSGVRRMRCRGSHLSHLSLRAKPTRSHKPTYLPIRFMSKCKLLLF